MKGDCTGKCIRVIIGRLRFYNWHEKNRSRLKLSAFAREIEFLEDGMEEIKNSKTNQIYLEGYICKSSIYRRTL